MAGATDIPVVAASLWTLTPWLPGCGTVYLVRPLGELAPDPTATWRDAGMSWICERAAVRAVICTADRAWVRANVTGAARIADALAGVARDPADLARWEELGARMRPTPAEVLAPWWTGLARA